MNWLVNPAPQHESSGARPTTYGTRQKRCLFSLSLGQYLISLRDTLYHSDNTYLRFPLPRVAVVYLCITAVVNERSDPPSHVT